MSSRVLKKILEDPHFDTKNEEQCSTNETSTLKEISGKYLRHNRYDLLNPDSLSESDTEQDDEEIVCTSAQSYKYDNYSTRKKEGKRKKQKIKNRNNSKNNNKLNEESPVKDNHFVNKIEKPATTNTSVGTEEVVNCFLSVNTKYLNPRYEMCRIFGNKVVKLENKRRRGQKFTLKTTYLITPKDSWPPISNDIISMTICEPPNYAKSYNNITWYCFEHSKSYQNIQNMFLSAVERMDYDFLVKIIKRCPYHVDALVQLSELCKETDNYSIATELIERAVLILETSLHPTFSLTSGKCRLDYRRQLNRSFFVVLFKHAQYLEAKSCCMSAFEISKLIFNLDPETDPVAIVLVIDYYALRCKQFAWLVKFYEQWEKLKNLSQLPNMAYSYALSLFYLNGDSEKSNNAIQYALLMFPGVLRPLLQELSVQTDKRVTCHTFFNSEKSRNQSLALDQLICLYVCRAKVTWRDPKIIPWLEKNVDLILNKVDNGDELKNENIKHLQRYISPPKAVLRHVILSDYKEKVPLAPFISNDVDSIVVYDPLPPLDSINTYEKMNVNQSRNFSTNPPAITFFQSILPTFQLQEVARENVGQAERGNQLGLAEINANPENTEGATATTYQELQNSLSSIITTIREYLSSIHITGDEQGVNDTLDDSNEDSDN